VGLEKKKKEGRKGKERKRKKVYLSFCPKRPRLIIFMWSGQR
jgi:ribosomal protein L18